MADNGRLSLKRPFNYSPGETVPDRELPRKYRRCERLRWPICNPNCVLCLELSSLLENAYNDAQSRSTEHPVCRLE
jgi:hypothetical protein